MNAASYKRIAFVASPHAEAGEALARLAASYGNAPTEEADVIVALGGDGFMLQTLHRFMASRKPIYGYDSTRSGSPLDTHGRNIYVDTFDSAYGRGWFRENAFLVHRPTGAFCYGFYPHGSRPPGKGVKYRATVIGPGVTPDLFWLGDAPGAYDPGRDFEANQQLRALGDRRCRPN